MNMPVTHDPHGSQCLAAIMTLHRCWGDHLPRTIHKESEGPCSFNEYRDFCIKHALSAFNDRKLVSLTEQVDSPIARYFHLTFEEPRKSGRGRGSIHFICGFDEYAAMLVEVEREAMENDTKLRAGSPRKSLKERGDTL